jgi:hypothetical protein
MGLIGGLSSGLQALAEASPAAARMLSLGSRAIPVAGNVLLARDHANAVANAETAGGERVSHERAKRQVLSRFARIHRAFRTTLAARKIDCTDNVSLEKIRR